MADLVVKSKVREAAAAKGMRISGDAFDSLSAVVSSCIDKASERSKSNGRKTIKGYDC